MFARLPNSARLSSVVFLLRLYLSTKRGAKSIDAQYRGSALLITEEDLGQAWWSSGKWPRARRPEARAHLASLAHSDHSDSCCRDRWRWRKSGSFSGKCRFWWALASLCRSFTSVSSLYAESFRWGSSKSWRLAHCGATPSRFETFCPTVAQARAWSAAFLEFYRGNRPR